MAYPRQCPRCGADYRAAGVTDLGHATVRSEPGGTRSPWRPALRGRLLTLRCLACCGEYGWDYFADARKPAAAPGVPPCPAGVPPLLWLAVRTGRVAPPDPDRGCLGRGFGDQEPDSVTSSARTTRRSV
jgi:hypothetical protein